MKTTTTLKRLACLAITVILAVSLVACSADKTETSDDPNTSCFTRDWLGANQTSSVMTAEEIDAWLLESVENGEPLTHYWRHMAEKRGYIDSTDCTVSSCSLYHDIPTDFWRRHTERYANNTDEN